MVAFQNTRIWRGGETTRVRTIGTRSCEALVEDGLLKLQFKIPSKGGGTTAISVSIPPADIEVMLQELSSNMPVLAPALCEAAAIASKMNIDLLDESAARDKKVSELIEKAMDSLDPVEDYIDQKYIDAPTSEDSEEKRVRDALKEASNALRNTRPSVDWQRRAIRRLAAKLTGTAATKQARSPR